MASSGQVRWPSGPRTVFFDDVASSTTDPPDAALALSAIDDRCDSGRTIRELAPSLDAV